MRRIAPPDPPGLRDREAELEELARFCLDPGGPAYAWWRAGAWAGKSALMSAFVLRPPAPVAERVRIVSFFITARLAAQDNREAFTVVLLEQLAELTGQELPLALPEATREGYLLDLLAEAASACQQAGGRLVLVIDGLDEDRGVTAGPDAHSIAGLLPSEPPSGMKVIVAGRPNPPVPDDVPDWHPLRDPAIIRPLAASPHAWDMQRLGRQELHRLLSGSEPGRDLLGLLTAARGGLSGPDLAELSGVPLWETEEILHTAAGRTFTRRASRWAPATGPEVYLLGHEELQAAAERYLSGRLPGYRDRLHEWADAYRERGWPPETPEYLLGGYYGLLAAVGDLPRMTACATDAARHDRMLEVTGGDAAGLAEARAALDLIVTQEPPDLVRALAVARHRDQLNDRNRNIPVILPAAWACLGQVTRAEALASSIAEPHRQALALTSVAEVLTRAGQREHAAEIASQAQTVLRSIVDPERLTEALAQVAGVLERAGQHENAAQAARQAEAVALGYEEGPIVQSRVMALAAKALAGTGQDQNAAAVARRAEAAARAASDAEVQGRALAQAATALAAAGYRNEAAMIIAEAEKSAHAVGTPQEQAMLLVSIGESLVHVGKREDAIRVAGLAETAAQSIPAPGTQASHLLAVAKCLARAGEHQHAESIAHAIAQQQRRAEALASIAEALAKGGQHQHAAAIAQAITSPNWQAEALAQIAYALSEAGKAEDAVVVAAQVETAARSVNDLKTQAEVRTSIVSLLAGSGHCQEAAAVAGQAETIARVIEDPEDQAQALALTAEALAESKQCERAAAVADEAAISARFIADPQHRVPVLTRVARVLAEAGKHQQATSISREAETAAYSIADPFFRANRLMWTVEVMADLGQYEEAQAVARAITEPVSRPYSVTQIAIALAHEGKHQHAREMVEQAETAAESITRPGLKAMALANMAGALTETHPEQAAAFTEQADSIAQTLPLDQFENSNAMALVAIALAKTGQYRQAESAVRAAYPGNQPVHNMFLRQVAMALAQAEQYAQAEKVARAITHSEQQAEALAWIAAVMTHQAEEIPSAVRLTAEACASGRWPSIVAPILGLDSSAAADVARMLEDDWSI